MRHYTEEERALFKELLISLSGEYEALDEFSKRSGEIAVIRRSHSEHEAITRCIKSLYEGTDFDSCYKRLPERGENARFRELIGAERRKRTG